MQFGIRRCTAIWNMNTGMGNDSEDEHVVVVVVVVVHEGSMTTRGRGQREKRDM